MDPISGLAASDFDFDGTDNCDGVENAAVPATNVAATIIDGVCFMVRWVLDYVSIERRAAPSNMRASTFNRGRTNEKRGLVVAAGGRVLSWFFASFISSFILAFVL